MCGINWNQKKQRSLILYTFSLYNTFCNKLLTNNIYLLNIYYERSLQLKHKKTLLTFLMLCGLFILSKPVSAAKVPVIKAGKSTNLKGTIINVNHLLRLVLRFMYHARHFLLIMEFMLLIQQMVTLLQ